MDQHRSAETADRVELRSLVEAYAIGCDTKRYDEIAACFTEDALLELCMTPGSPEPTTVHRGTAEIRRAMTNLDSYVATSHVVGGQGVMLEGDRARGETTCIAAHVLERPDGRRLYTMGIRYEDQFSRVGGHWRMAQRRLVLLWSERRKLEG